MILLETSSNKLKKLDSFLMRHKAVIIIATLSLILFNSVLYIGKVPTASMENTIPAKSLIVGNRLYQEIERGDIVIFEQSGRYLIKRVIGLPNDTVEITKDALYVNSEKYKEEYLKEEPSYKASAFSLDNNSYFLMGDNRNNSADSRTFGAVKEDAIVAKLIFSIKPPWAEKRRS